MITDVQATVLCVIRDHPHAHGQQLTYLAGINKRNGHPMKPQGAGGWAMRYCKMLRTYGYVEERLTRSHRLIGYRLTQKGKEALVEFNRAPASALAEKS